MQIIVSLYYLLNILNIPLLHITEHTLFLSVIFIILL